MPLLKNAELWHPRLVPNRPNKKFNRDNPTWEVQLRTADPEVRKAWEAEGVKTKAVVPDDGGKPFWKVTLRKKTVLKSGEPAAPVEVKGGGLQDIDPATIGNGSMGNVRVTQYEYPKTDGGMGIATVLQGIQLTKYKKYTPKPRDDDFQEEDMEIIEEDEDNDEPEEEAPEEETPKPKAPPKKKFD